MISIQIFWEIKYQVMNFIMNKRNLSALFLGVLFVILIWHLSSIMVNNDIVIPKVNSVFSSFVNLLTNGRTYYIIILTILRLVLIICISFVISLILVGLSIYSKRIQFFIKPTISFIRATPIVAIIIILLVVIGNNKTPPIVTSFILIPLFYESLFIGINSIDENIIDDVRTISNFSLQILFKMYIPLVFSQIITSLVQGFGLGLKSLVMSEFIAQPRNSIGYEILQNKINLQMDYVFAWTIILIIFVLIVEIIIYRFFKTDLAIFK